MSTQDALGVLEQQVLQRGFELGFELGRMAGARAALRRVLARQGLEFGSTVRRNESRTSIP